MSPNADFCQYIQLLKCGRKQIKLKSMLCTNLFLWFNAAGNQKLLNLLGMPQSTPQSTSLNTVTKTMQTQGDDCKLWLLLSWAAVAAITTPALNGWGFNLWAPLGSLGADIPRVWDPVSTACTEGSWAPLHQLEILAFIDAGYFAPVSWGFYESFFHYSWTKWKHTEAAVVFLGAETRGIHSSYRFPTCSGCCRAPAVPKVSCLVSTKQWHAVAQHQRLSAHLHFSIP